MYILFMLQDGDMGEKQELAAKFHAKGNRNTTVMCKIHT